MPRRREVPKRNIDPDPKFGDRLVSKFMNVVMTSGKKSVAESIVYGAFDLVADPRRLRRGQAWPLQRRGGNRRDSFLALGRASHADRCL